MTTLRSPLRLITSLAMLACVGLAPACYDGMDDSAPAQDGVEPEVDDEAPTADPGSYLSGIDAEFRGAAEEFGVPVQVLQAVGYAETQWQMIEGMSEFEGQEPAYGVMALRGEHLGLGAGLIGATLEQVKTDRRTNIRAAAAVLRSYADDIEIDRDDLGAWAPAIAAMSDIEVEEALINYVHHDVYGLIRGGLEIVDVAGQPVASLSPEVVEADFAAPTNPTAAPGPDYAGSIWRPSPNYSSRPANASGKVRMVIIHSCEGGYSGCWGWLTNPNAGVSAHYVIKEDGSEISQLVRESQKGWHIGASYDCKLNSSKLCDLQGYNANNFTVGIEHAGFAKQASWNSNLINQSAKLTCDITKAHAIPRDKYHIVAHGQLQPYNRIDPGPNWPWTTYLNKVNEYCGAQPAPEPAPQPQPAPTSIIIDSNNANNNQSVAKITVSSNWTTSAASPGYYGSGYWFASTQAVSDGASFEFYLPAAATRTVDAWWVAGSNRSTSAPFVMFDSAGVKLGTVNVNQQTNGGKWVQLGTYNFKAGWNKVVLSRWTTTGFVVIADAVRIR